MRKKKKPLSKNTHAAVPVMKFCNFRADEILKTNRQGHGQRTSSYTKHSGFSSCEYLVQHFTDHGTMEGYPFSGEVRTILYYYFESFSSRTDRSSLYLSVSVCVSLSLFNNTPSLIKLVGERMFCDGFQVQFSPPFWSTWSVHVMGVGSGKFVFVLFRFQVLRSVDVSYSLVFSF